MSFFRKVGRKNKGKASSVVKRTFACRVRGTRTTGIRANGRWNMNREWYYTGDGISPGTIHVCSRGCAIADAQKTGSLVEFNTGPTER